MATIAPGTSASDDMMKFVYKLSPRLDDSKAIEKNTRPIENNRNDRTAVRTNGLVLLNK